MSDLFSVDHERLSADLAVITVAGEVDIYTAPHLKECLLGLLDEGVWRVVVDLSSVSFIDSTALGVLIGAVRRVNDNDGSMALVVTGRSVRRVLSITGLDRVLAIYDTRAAAIEALS